MGQKIPTHTGAGHTADPPHHTAQDTATEQQGDTATHTGHTTQHSRRGHAHAERKIVHHCTSICAKMIAWGTRARGLPSVHVLYLLPLERTHPRAQTKGSVLFLMQRGSKSGSRYY